MTADDEPEQPSRSAPSAKPRAGRVTLVGAGPGEPDLLTIRAARRLAEADLVLYDALSSEGMRAYAPCARWFYVGKRACRQSIGQDILNRLMIKEARRGHHVVRLKCGDPFVFGRGGEEMWALAEAGVPCEVVPGVSSAVAGPALAGIPVTHRGAASAFTVIAGHHRAVYGPLLSALPSQGMTVVVLMGLAERASIASTLIGCGWAPATPAAIVIGAATPAAWRWTGTLDQLGGVALPQRDPGGTGTRADAADPDDGDGRVGAPPPGLLVIGQVVAVATQLEVMKNQTAATSEPSSSSEPQSNQPSGGVRG
ncbi:MAG: uroporphyrinogen-III C-methyltransferase [Polyangia bacterium]